MKSIEILRAEHEIVRRLMECLGALACEARVLDNVDGEAATSLLSLLERFVDWSHQDKEELHLFPHMLARVTPEEAERLGSVFDDHARERRRLIGMCLHIEGAIQGKSVSVSRFVTNALIYTRLQRRHVDEEDGYVLPLAETVLTKEDDRRILVGFRQIDRRLGGIGDVRREVNALCRRFDVGEVEGVSPPRRHVAAAR